MKSGLFVEIRIEKRPRNDDGGLNSQATRQLMAWLISEATTNGQEIDAFQSYCLTATGVSFFPYLVMCCAAQISPPNLLSGKTPQSITQQITRRTLVCLFGTQLSDLIEGKRLRYQACT